MKIFHQLKHVFRKLSPLEVAVSELVEAELAKLAAETGREYAEAAVQYNTSRIRRLKTFIAASTKTPPTSDSREMP